jgi:glutamyl-tRNA synthetase
MPQFAHLPLILKPDGNGKLSKRDGDRLGFPVFSLDWYDPFSGEKSSGYREAGYLPSAFLNILALLGWHPSDNQELFSMEELIEKFSLEKVSKSGAKFDPEKAKWFNHQYLKNADNDELMLHFNKQLEENNITGFSDDYIRTACGLIKEKATFIKDFWMIGSYFFQTPTTFDDSVIQKKWDEKASDFMIELVNKYKSDDDFTPQFCHETYEKVCAQFEVKPGQYMQLLRVILTGVGGGPSLWDIVSLLGKGTVIDRIEDKINTINKS